MLLGAKLRKIGQRTEYFTKMPPELIEYLFTFIDGHSLKNCCLVNRLFNEVISESTKLMSRFTLFLDGGFQEMGEIVELTRPYQSVGIYNLKREEYEDALKGLQIAGRKATKVVISTSDLPEDSQLLSCFPNVVKLHFVGKVPLPEIIEQSSFSKLEYFTSFEQVHVSRLVSCWLNLFNNNTLATDPPVQAFQRL